MTSFWVRRAGPKGAGRRSRHHFGQTGAYDQLLGQEGRAKKGQGAGLVIRL